MKPFSRANCEIVLQRYDKTLDGKLDAQECYKLISDFVGPELIHEIDVKSVLALADLDGSTTIEIDEISGLLKSLDIFSRPDTQNYLNSVWEKYDKDASKILEKKEIRSVLKDVSGRSVKDEEVEKMIKRCSKDGDGAISKFEFMYLISEWFANGASAETTKSDEIKNKNHNENDT